MKKIEDYALIGDCHSAALVGRDGSIDWLCWPRFDSPACFAALLGTPQHGRWRIGPASAPTSMERRYRKDTLILETRFETAEGAFELLDFMPVRDRRCDLIRIVRGRRGRVRVDMELVLRFDYGASVPWVTRLPDGAGVRAVAGPDMVTLRSPVPLEGRELATRASFELAAGDERRFVLTHQPSHIEQDDTELDVASALARTQRFWRRWCEKCEVTDEWADAVRRSAITLKALTYAPTGGIVAAPTTSLPERIGGVRNWDYRYCWLRDATLTLLALLDAGYAEEAAAWRKWLLRAAAGSPQQMQIMYGLAGERRLPEWEVSWLPGYAGSAPVRVGNAASRQLQLDVYGEVLDALHQARKAGLAGHEASWGLQRTLLEHLQTVWRQPDHGLWEVRGPPRHFTYSKVMCWVAFDRAVKAVEQFGRSGPVEHWRQVRDAIHADVCRNGVCAGGYFAQSYGSQALDASLLLIPITGFLPIDDPRVAATIAAVQRELTVDGLVLRYRTHEALDGLPPGEGVFLACSFWLVDCLCMQGRMAEARALFERLLGLCNEVGLLAEQYDPAAKRQLGNFPQAFSHVALINSALGLAASERRTREAASPTEERAAT
ncbi:MAG: glycoside hydrolase family 15 protein [Betaproteobacteria bacterium]